MQKLFRPLMTLFILSLSSTVVRAQSTTVDSLIKNFEFKKARQFIAESQLDSMQMNFQLFKYFNEKSVLDSAYYYLYKIDSTALNLTDKGYYYYYYAQIMESENKEDLALPFYKQAQQLFEQDNNIKMANEINFDFYATLISQRNFEYPKEVYLDRYINIAKKNKFYDQLANAYLDKAIGAMQPHQPDSVKHYIKVSEKFGELSNDLSFLSRLAAIRGLYHTEITKELDSADFYFEKENRLLGQQKLNYRALYNYINKANVARKRDDIELAIDLLLMADSIPHDLYRKNNKIILYDALSGDYEALGDTEKALYYLNLYLVYQDSVNVESQNTNLTRFRASERELEILKEQQASARNKNIAFGLGGTLFLGSIIAFLVYRNAKRKQRIAEQEKEIEVQKTEKILKEQELNTIDAMIAGQEKERQRLASDLHDSVGATLSAAKMQFEHLKKHRGSLNNEDELYDRTQLLLEEAYTEVRAMAHTKNSGVIAKNGLLPAVNKLAQNASATGKIQIEVQDYGLDQRLEGSLEIAVFRIIQELVTNIIKHAEASEASISLTQHEDAINVVVEDNGKGFKAGQLSNNSGGMGLGSIEKRVEHMEGQMEVDSTQGKGTSVIIDIPL